MSVSPEPTWHALPACEELSAEELDVADPRFALVACAHAEKAR
jgi:hypothetical protein